MTPRGHPLSNLKMGESATIETIAPTHTMRKRLLELGFIPGANIQVLRAAPFGDPIEVMVGGTHFALRKTDMAQIFVEPNHNQTKTAGWK